MAFAGSAPRLASEVVTEYGVELTSVAVGTVATGAASIASARSGPDAQ